MPKADPSPRAASKVTLSYSIPINGLEIPVQIPVTLYTGTVSDHGVKRKSFVHTDDGDHEVGQQNYDKSTGDVVAYSEIVMKVQTEYGPVYIEDHEIEKMFEITPDTVVVKHFQPLHMFHQGHYVPKSLQFIEPRVNGSGKNKGPDKNAVKVLNTLLKAMREKGACAIVEVTTRGVPKPAIITPDGVLWYVHHTDALREQRELPEYDPTDAEVATMGLAIDGKWSTDVLDLTDERSALIQNLADEKARAGDFDRSETPEREAAPEPQSNDIMALLMASVEQAKAESA